MSDTIDYNSSVEENKEEHETNAGHTTTTVQRVQTRGGAEAEPHLHSLSRLRARDPTAPDRGGEYGPADEDDFVDRAQLRVHQWIQSILFHPLTDRLSQLIYIRSLWIHVVICLVVMVVSWNEQTLLQRIGCDCKLRAPHAPLPGSLSNLFCSRRISC